MLLAGLLNLASVLVPRGRPLLELLDALVPGAISEGATALTAASGIGLVLLSGGLRRHRRSAYLATLALLGCSAVLHLIKGLDLGAALLEAFLAGILVARGEDFTARLGPGERAPLLLPALAVPVATVGYGMLGLLVNQGDVATDRGPRHRGRRGGAGVLPRGRHRGAGRRRPARPPPGLAGRHCRLPRRGGAAGPGRRRDRLRRRGGRPLRRRRPAQPVPRRRGGHRPGRLQPGRASHADRAPELEPGEARGAQLPDRALRRAGRRHPLRAGRHLRPLAGRDRRARLLDGAGPPVRPARRRRHRGRRARRRRPRPRLPAPGAVGARWGQSGRDAPGAGRTGDPERLPDRRGGHAPARPGRAADVAQLLVPASGAGGRRRREGPAGTAARLPPVAAAVRAVPDRVAVPLQQEVPAALGAEIPGVRGHGGPAPRGPGRPARRGPARPPRAGRDRPHPRALPRVTAPAAG